MTRSSYLPAPTVRRLRGYAFDPSLSLRRDTAQVNETIFRLPWEPLDPGPVGEYLEVVDHDPASGCFYEPVNLDAAEALAQDGLAPSEGCPQFHQQMVYAVVMNTVRHFEYALGRPIHWAHRYDEQRPAGERDVNVPRLRIYPHALRAANAYYSPQKKALLFGYFMGPAGMVFTCLSHDIVAHEATHALLDGMHRRFIEDNHPDTLAFHEAFADLVALLQHFTFAEVLAHQIAQTRGDLQAESLLGQLAQQFGQATGRYGALRNAIGEIDADGRWRLLQPDPARLQATLEPHARGAILVAAVFGAFLTMYEARAQSTIRLATGGSGVLPGGALHPLLVARLAAEASATARKFLHICIRALDYCPPVDVTFGDYLRAMITADFDMVPDDPEGHRIALIESFRRWGVMPTGLRTISEEQLRWPLAETDDHAGWTALGDVAQRLRQRVSETLYLKDRAELFERLRQARAFTHDYLRTALSDKSDQAHRPEFERITGVVFADPDRLPGLRRDGTGHGSFEVHAVRPAIRVGPTGTLVKQMMITITQRRSVPLDPARPDGERFDFRGGSTLVFDLEGEPRLRHAVTRPIGDEARLAAVRAWRSGRTRERLSLRDSYFGAAVEQAAEPFCLLHEGH